MKSDNFVIDPDDDTPCSGLFDLSPLFSHLLSDPLVTHKHKASSHFFLFFNVEHSVLFEPVLLQAADLESNFTFTLLGSSSRDLIKTLLLVMKES